MVHPLRALCRNKGLIFEKQRCLLQHRTCLGGETGKTQNYGKTLWILFISAIFIGGILSYFASKNPDGLEWAIQGIIGMQNFQELETSSLVMNQGVTGGVVIILFGIIAGLIIKKVKGRQY